MVVCAQLVQDCRVCELPVIAVLTCGVACVCVQVVSDFLTVMDGVRKCACSCVCVYVCVCACVFVVLCMRHVGRWGKGGGRRDDINQRLPFRFLLDKAFVAH